MAYGSVNVPGVIKTPTNEDMENLKAEINDLKSLITYGTDDLTPGSSPLNTGDVYLVYE